MSTRFEFIRANTDGSVDALYSKSAYDTCVRDCLNFIKESLYDPWTAEAFFESKGIAIFDEPLPHSHFQNEADYHADIIKTMVEYLFVYHEQTHEWSWVSLNYPRDGQNLLLCGKPVSIRFRHGEHV